MPRFLHMSLRSNLLLTFLFLVILTLWIISYVINNIYQVVDEFELFRINNLIKEYKKESLIIRNQILEAQSLRIISEQAKTQGFIPSKIIYLK